MSGKIFSGLRALLPWAISAGLHDFGCSDIPQPRAFLPWDSPPACLSPDEVSGPLWTGPLAKTEVLEALNADRALEWCSLLLDEHSEGGLADAAAIARVGWDENDLRTAQRSVVRSVARLTDWSFAISANGIITMDELPKWAAITGPPSVAKLVNRLKDEGHAAAVSPLSAPAIQTDAPWDVLLRTAKGCFES